MKNRNLKHVDNWAPPKWFYDKLNDEFNFDFDPCPLNEGEILPEKDTDRTILFIPFGKDRFNF